ncbi:MAG: hypothetical protein E6R03_16830 [Hyphomicrobiaceae bacterium]|nr:MAG: hypothetical protein E6R03_16830 [Hyphomicrobiaceae bacterium]
MAYGILVKNTSGHILVSSEIESLSCAGIASYVSLEYSGLTDFPDFDDVNTLSGRCIHRYRWQGTAMPLFFIKPTNYDLFHGILNQWSSGGFQYVDVIQSGGVSAPPTLYVFVPPRVLTASGNIGIRTNLSNGQVAFDSRLKPLAIHWAGSVIPQTIPCDGGQPTVQSGFAWNDTTLDHAFTSDNTYNAYAMNTPYARSSLMFSAPSIAQAVYTRQKNGFKRSSGTYSSQDHWSTAVWWAMYHSSYRIGVDAFHAGWSVYGAGYTFTSTWESSGWYEFSGGGGTVQTGSRPYNDKTINLVYNTAIVANADHYI